MYKRSDDLFFNGLTLASAVRAGGLFVFFVACAIGLSAQTKVPKRAQKQLDEAVERFMNRDIEGAFEGVDEALKTFPAFADAWMLKSQLHEGRSEWEAAVKALNQAITSNPELLRKWRDKLVRLEFNAGQYPAALALIEEVAIEDSLLDASVRFAAQAIAAPVELNLAPLRGTVNSEAP